MKGFASLLKAKVESTKQMVPEDFLFIFVRRLQGYLCAFIGRVQPAASQETQLITKAMAQ